MGRRLIGWLLQVVLLLSGGLFFHPFPSEAKLADSAWPMWRHDLQHTGRSPYSGPATPYLAWTFATGYYIQSEPAIGADGTIYVSASSDDKLYAINPDGSKKWEFATPMGIRSSAAIGADGTIYVGSMGFKLYAVQGTPITSPSPTPTPSASPSPSPSPTSSPSPSPSPSPSTPPSSFTDVPPGYWAHDEIMSLVTAGVINGYPDGTFKPENPVTRAEFAKMALLSLGYTL